MLELKEQLLNHFNSHWVEKHITNLQIDEIELCMKGNARFHANDQGLTVHNWIQKYGQAETHEFYVSAPNSLAKKAKGTSLSIELYIDMEKVSQFKACENHHCPTHFIIHTNPETRGNTSCPDRTQYQFQVNGLLQINQLELLDGSEGRTKNVYGLVIGQDRFVAKKLVDIGDGSVLDGVPLEVATKYLTAEIIRLARMQLFVKQFFACAKHEGGEVADFCMTEAFLIKLYWTLLAVPKEGNEDNKQMVEDETAPVLDSVYLVEPRQTTTTVIKFSRMLEVSNANNKKMATLMAFAHFVLKVTACQYMFADIQGSIEMSTLNKSIITLFDLMTHTPHGKSRLGDCRLHGIRDFIWHHHCNQICLTLRLCSAAMLNATCQSLSGGQADSLPADIDNLDDLDQLDDED
ncbi:hypothetical protein BDN71DRAFT_1430551 [Pleurotus eryngii]|uniref:Alpha-type protein kinase domain-containing protein n=1 Tax=Pleurotus eryngii TaxID=5323 RepID=A0A9P6A2G7_PLEER|nr:hypothetical protein BDN71DRAFT_1430551 [Pleurotus eryngii]